MFLNVPLREHEMKWLENYRHYENSLQYKESAKALVKNHKLSKDIGIAKRLSNKDLKKMSQDGQDIRKYFGKFSLLLVKQKIQNCVNATR